MAEILDIFHKKMVQRLVATMSTIVMLIIVIQMRLLNIINGMTYLDQNRIIIPSLHVKASMMSCRNCQVFLRKVLFVTGKNLERKRRACGVKTVSIRNNRMNTWWKGSVSIVERQDICLVIVPMATLLLLGLSPVLLVIANPHQCLQRAFSSSSRKLTVYRKWQRAQLAFS